MSLKNLSLAIGMSALGSFWVTPARVEAQDTLPPVSPSLPASIAPASPKAYAVLLLTNGRILKGKITEDATGANFVLSQKGGTILFPKREAEKAFVSLEELYQYKRARVPDGDTDEKYKLAKWCLEQGLEVHARENLQSVLGASPGFVPAQRMIANIDANADVRRPDGAISDPSVALTGGEMPAPAAAQFDPKVAKARREMMKSGGVPVIFDLPTPIAVKRATEFTRSIHFVLQQNCASCHNEKYQGEFQLIQVKLRREQTPDVLRANLDAVLPLINRETPDRSEVLAAALLPHGPERRQILRGPRDPQFLKLQEWVYSLRSGASPADSAVTAAGSGAPSSGGFGRDRAGAAGPTPIGAGDKMPSLSPVPDAAGLYSGGGALTPEQITKMASNPGARIQSSTYSSSGAAPGVPPGVQFPTPGLPPLPGPAAAPPQAPAPRSPATPRPGTAAPVPASAPASTPPAKAKAKPLDPALLEKMLKARQAGGQP